MSSSDASMKPPDPPFSTASTTTASTPSPARARLSKDMKWTKEENDLLNAAKHGNNVAMKRILEENRDINVNIFDENSSTPLLLSITRDHSDCCETLLNHENSAGKRPVDVNHIDHNGSNSLLVAVQVGSIEMVNMLLEHPYLHLNQRNTTTGTTPIIEASRKDYLTIVKRLLHFHREIALSEKKNQIRRDSLSDETPKFLDKYLLTEHDLSLGVKDEVVVDLGIVDLHGNNAMFYANFNINQGKSSAKLIKAELNQAPYQKKVFGCCLIS